MFQCFFLQTADMSPVIKYNCFPWLKPHEWGKEMHWLRSAFVKLCAITAQNRTRKKQNRKKTGKKEIELIMN